MSEQHTGGCQCGALRYRTTGAPQRAGVCHCRYCQLRTGSAFGVSAYFNSDQVEIISGSVKTYPFETESGRNFTTQFCPTCGTNVLWTLDMFEGLIGVAAGTFDPPTFWFDVDREVFTRTRAPFVHLDVAHHFETSSSYNPVCEDPIARRGDR